MRFKFFSNMNTNNLNRDISEFRKDSSAYDAGSTSQINVEIELVKGEDVRVLFKCKFWYIVQSICKYVISYDLIRGS